MPKEATKTRKTRGAKSEKRKKDPNAPKRGLSAYMFFANDNRDKVREENPGIKFGEVGKLLGERWKELTDKDKKKYEDQAKIDKERYETEKAQYLATGTYGGSEEEEE